MKKVLVLGASGLLGLNFAMQAQEEYVVQGVVHSQALAGAPFHVIQADLLQEDKLQQIIAESDADYLVNCVALADLEACEKDAARANLLNRDLAGRVAQACRQSGIALVHISTDAVFDGERGDYSEDYAVNPLSIYARSKFEGEEAVRKEFPKAIIARVNFFGWSLSGRRSLAEFFCNNLVDGHPIKGLTDRFFNPLHASQLSELLLKMLDAGLSGTFHVGSPIALSKYDFGVAIARQFGLDEALIEEANSADFGYQAARSPNLTMNVEKLSRALEIDLPDVHSGIKKLFEQKQLGYRQKLRMMHAEGKSQIANAREGI